MNTTSSYLKVGTENSIDINLYYEDQGSGKPVVLISGWPLGGASWEKQTMALLAAGYRVITYDRRGFGKSTKASGPYDYDTLAADLDKLITFLDLKEATLVGFSTGGGEVARYIGTYGESRVAKASFWGAVPPWFIKVGDNPSGVDRSVFDGIRAGLIADRPAFMAGFCKNFFNHDILGGTRISEEALKDTWNFCMLASPKATYDITLAWEEDFRGDLARITVPTLVVHGDADRIVPIDVAGKLTHAAVKGSEIVIIKDGPHAFNWTHADEANKALLDFLAR